MSQVFVRRLLLSAAVIAFAVPAAAQDAPATAASTQPEADDTAPDDAIIVTARRREEQSQDIPLAISVVGGEQLDNTGAFNVGRLQQLTPTVQYYSSNPRNTSLSIRGIGAPFGLTNDGFEQGVGIYVDDIYYSRVASATFDFLDVAQIEVLRGPQGTLYGKNTTAGAINIQTNQPSFTPEGRIEATIGNLGFKQVKAALSGPLSDNVAARLALSGTSRRGTLFNVATGTYINEQDNIGLRGQVLWQAGDTLDLTLSGDYSTQNPECCGTVYVRTGATQRPLYRQYEALAAAQGYAPPSRDPFDRLTDVDADLSARNEIGGVGLRAVWDLGDGTLTSATAWRFWDWGPANDRDFTGLPITTRSQNPSQQNQYTQELRYNYSAGNVDAVLGLFGFHQTVRTQGTESLGSAASRWLLNPGNVQVGSSGCATPTTLACDPTVLDGVVAYNDIRLDNTSAALFGQVSWEVTPGLTLQPGVRLNWDKKNGLYERLVFDGADNPVLFRDAQGIPITNPRTVARRDALTPQRIEPSFSDWNFSYDFTASYQIAPEVLGYATYARSFKTGGINLNGVPNDSQGNPLIAVGAIRPETVDHYEAGLKTELPGRLGVFNLAAFRTDVGDYQALVNAGQVSTTRGYLANAEKVRTQGLEADITVQPSDRFRAYANAAYTDAKYVRFTGAPCPPELSGGGSGTPVAAPGTPGNSPASCDISGQRIAGVSKWSLSYGAEANVPVNLLGQPGEVYLGFDGNFRSRFSSNPSPSAYTWIDGYSLANFRLGFRTDEGANLFVWVRNAFDEEFFELLSVAPGSTGLIAGQPGDPRTFGLTLAHNF
ncbi:TonB-dependent receptor [Alteraurantiacibacter buctensis]|uniref:TonB-dependent receptor n=1 Tax=Alteraurantiacibacter buctensis TaxID=1503981 RepID=A0A844Z0Y5_9SPHN|nr:TonB-dependent receptor [Alteraurantiacibacter buctensis]MXO72067.1 TonB-dependent receptor [Alteraurantiacibacter buctensis]